MCCATRLPIGRAIAAEGCMCGCWGMPGRFGRQFLSTEERMEALEAYRKELVKEAAEVEKTIAELKSAT